MRRASESNRGKKSPKNEARGSVTDKVLCSQVCRARCCSWSFIEVTPEEVEVLKQRAVELHLPEPPIVAYDRDGTEAYIMHATPCVFLSKDNLCSVYRDRPQHCRDFPDTWREWCPLSKRVFEASSLSYYR